MISLHEFLDTCYWKLHCMYTNFCLKTSVVIGSDLKLGPTVAVTVLLLYKYVFHTYIGTFAVCGWYVCNAGCL